MESKIVVVDIDSLVYESISRAMDVQEAVDGFGHRLADIIYHVKRKYYVKKIILCGFSPTNYRKVIDPMYKAQRGEKPKMYDDVKKELLLSYDILSIRGVETDDLVAKYIQHYGDKMVCVSIDKDYLQFPCEIFNYRKREWIETSIEEAQYNFWCQMVIGDTADNVNYCKGYGKRWCEANLAGKSEYGMVREVFALFSHIYRNKARERFIQCYCLLKLNLF